MTKGDIDANTKKASSLVLKIGKAIVLCVLVVIMASMSMVYWAVQYYKNPGPLTNTQNVIIPSGSSSSSIAKLLAEKGVIEKPDLFKIIIRVSQSAGSMKAGQYQFDPQISPAQVFEKITSGEVVVHHLTIPEGLMTSQVLQLVKDAPYLTGDISLDIKEGELLPETYDYTYGDSRDKIVKRMKKAMTDTIDKAWENRVDGLPISNKYEALILASIVEKETGVPDELRRVAAVFVNRIHKKMRLQTDPTVIYAITKGEYVLKRPLLYKDLEKQSPYNTYRQAGLPPTPISNPGKAAIEATLNPLVTNEIYFVADGTGGHQFASTLKEHNKNVRVWRKINKARRKQAQTNK